MIDTSPKKRFDILVEEQILPLVAKAIKAAGFSGHTVLPVLGGSGTHGAWSDERLTSSSRVMVIAIGAPDQSERLLDELAPILDSHRLVLSLSDCQVIRQENF